MYSRKTLLIKAVEEPRDFHPFFLLTEGHVVAVPASRGENRSFKMERFKLGAHRNGEKPSHFSAMRFLPSDHPPFGPIAHFSQRSLMGNPDTAPSAHSNRL